MRQNKTLKGLLAFILVLVGSLLLAAAFSPYATFTAKSFSVNAELNEVHDYLVDLYESNQSMTVKKEGLKGESVVLKEEYFCGFLKSTLNHQIELIPRKTKTRVNWTVTTKAFYPLNLYNYFLKTEITKKLNLESSKARGYFNPNMK